MSALPQRLKVAPSSLLPTRLSSSAPTSPARLSPSRQEPPAAVSNNNYGTTAVAATINNNSTNNNNHNMSRARKFIGGLLHRRSSERGTSGASSRERQRRDAGCAGTEGGSREDGGRGGGGGGGRDRGGGRSASLGEATTLLGHRRHHSDPFTRKGSATSTDSKENNPPPGGVAKVSSAPVTPRAGGSTGRGKYRPWRRPSVSWRSLTAAERRCVKAMLRLAVEADKRRGQAAHLEKTVLCMLDQLATDVDITAVVDNTQRLQLMQWSVINGWHQVLEQLLERHHPPATMDNDCNGPLHLACKLGDVRAAELLLRFGASVESRSTACYPSNSLHLMHNSPFGPSAYCFVHLNSTPLQIALAHDNVRVVELLLRQPALACPARQTFALHEACRCNAKACVEYLIRHKPAAVNERHPTLQETPLSIALVAGEGIVRTLLQGSARIEPEILRDCTGKGDSALHLLYVTENCPDLLGLTLLLQDCGTDMANCVDRAGNTPLHLLCARFALLGRREEIPAERQHLPDIYHCAQYLVSRTARVNATNRRGESFIHMLFSGCWTHFMYNCHLEALLKEACRVLHLLLSHGVSPDVSSRDLSPVVNTVVNCCCGLGPEKAEKVGYLFLESLDALCLYRADLSGPDEKGIYMLTRLLTACNRWLVGCAGKSGDPAARLVFTFVGAVLRRLFQAGGMSLPENILRIGVKQMAILTITPFDESGFCREACEILGLIFCSGLNPNSLAVFRDGGGDSSSSSVDDVKTDDLRYCLARGFVTHRDHSGGMMRFFSVFEETLDQPRLNAFTRVICLVLDTTFQESFFRHIGACVASLRRVTRRPRPLSSLCRIAINNALGWRVFENSKRLPLPVPLQVYLSDFR